MLAYSETVDLHLWRIEPYEGARARKFILPKSQAASFLRQDSTVPIKGTTKVTGSKTSSLYYSMPDPSHHKASPGPGSDIPMIEPTVAFVPLRLSCTGKEQAPRLFAPDAELDTVCKIFNDRLFPKAQTGERLSLTWKGQGLCHVVNGKVGTYGLGVQWADARGTRPKPAYRRGSIASQGASTTAKPQRSKSNFWSTRSAQSTSSQDQAPPMADSDTASRSSEHASSAFSSRKSSIASIASRASVSSMTARPAKITKVFFSIKRFGLIRTLQVAFCDSHQGQSQSSGCCMCQCIGKLGFEITAHTAQGKELNLEPIVAEKALDAAFEHGLQGMLEGHSLQISATLDSQKLLTGIKPRTAKWVTHDLFDQY